jgi:hypothetical protein
VYDVSTPTPIDDALELAAPLNYGPQGPAVSGAWAAVEALLLSPTDIEDGREGRAAVAADRMAVIVAASWPRGELTTLSHKHVPGTPDRLSIELETTATNSERARLVVDALANGRKLSLPKASDRAAEQRMRSLVHAIEGNRPATLDDGPIRRACQTGSTLSSRASIGLPTSSHRVVELLDELVAVAGSSGPKIHFPAVVSTSSPSTITSLFRPNGAKLGEPPIGYWAAP